MKGGEMGPCGEGGLMGLLRGQAGEFASCLKRPADAEYRDEAELVRLLRETADLGWTGLLIEADRGGEGAGWPEAVVVAEELAAREAPLAAMLVSHLVCSYGISLWGSEEQLRLLLPPLARCERLGAVGLTEPERGTDFDQPLASLAGNGESLLLNGNKCFVTNAGEGHGFALLTLARGEGGLAALCLLSDAPGLYLAHRYVFSGWEGLPNRALVLQDCKVPGDGLLREGLGRDDLIVLLDGAWLLVAALAAGMSRACLEEASAYARERKQGGGRLVFHQSLRFRLADMATGLELLRSSLYPAASRLQAGHGIHAEICMLKLFAVSRLEETASSAVEMGGGFGYTAESRLSRLWRQAKGLQFLWGTRELARLELARCLGL